MSKLTKALTAAAGNAGGTLGYVEDVFSTYLYTGTGATQTINNGIDLAGEGGLVWAKWRSGVLGSSDNALYDTERGVNNLIRSNTTNAEVNTGTGSNASLSAFNSDGFSLGADALYGRVNYSGTSMASWTFRKAEKFFDVVTYTGNGAANRQVPHNLGSVPGCIILKRYDTADDWKVYHVGADATAPEDYVLELNSTAARLDSISAWNDTAPTDSNFTVNSGGSYNASGGTYVAYLFASDAGGFGDDGSESIIKCGSYTGTGSALDVSLGFEPQWIMFKRSDSIGDWLIYDVMRGIVTGGSDERLEPNTSDAAASSVACEVTATGFTVTSTGTYMNASGGNYIYIAIRRPMKTPESGTEVFAIDTSNSTGNAPPQFSSSFPVDMAIRVDLSEAEAFRYRETRSRLVPSRLKLNTTDAEAGSNPSFFAYMDGCYDNTSANTSHYAWMFKRATGFFDVVAYTGTYTARTVNHNLGVVPELMIVKSRTNGARYWMVYSSAIGNDRYLVLNDNWAQSSSGETLWNSTTPTSDVFSVGAQNSTNENSQNYIAYLFATLAGVSKVFSVTKSSGSNANVDCGFSAGARFILLKRTDSTGDWYVWDSVRGIVSGNDPYLLLNSTAAEVTTTDYIDPLASGFTIVDGGLANGDYIGLAIA